MLSEEDVHVQVLPLSFMLKCYTCSVVSGHFLHFIFSCSLRSDKEEMSDLKNYKIKAQNEKKKKEILSSVYSE